MAQEVYVVVQLNEEHSFDHKMRRYRASLTTGVPYVCKTYAQARALADDKRRHKVPVFVHGPIPILGEDE
jgi:hypothetical protein